MSKSIVYVMASGDADLDNRISTEVKAALEAKGYNVSGIHIESQGFNSDVILSDVLEMVNDHSVRAIGVFSLAHLPSVMGSSRDLLEFIAFLSDNDVRLVAIKEGVDSQAPAGQFASAIVAVLAEVKRSIKSKKIHWRLKKAKSAGAHIGRPQKADANAIRALRASGRSLHEISQILAVSVGAVQYALRKVSDTESDQGPDLGPGSY